MEKKRKLVSTAPTRIDLAGGTLDIWPLYLLYENAATINLAIELPATVQLVPRDDSSIEITSVDQGISIQAANLEELKELQGLNLIRKIVDYYSPPAGFDLRIECEAPAGSGLGGSSSLAIALSAALNEISGKSLASKEIINAAADLEASILGVPTGKQDYYPAMYGGLNMILWRPGDPEVERIEPPGDFFDRLILCFTGQARFSGTTNWEITRARIDGDKSVTNKLQQILETAWKMREAFRQGNVDAVGQILEEEWENRKNLSEGVSNERIDSLLDMARAHGAISGKVCGAGGGGCLLFLTEAGRKHEVEVNLLRRGVQILSLQPDHAGLKLRWEDP
jgi:D-glycero-alpha-D-manno-heptose-7-phosphate kinase